MDTPRRVFLITYGAVGPSITACICMYQQLEIDECYTITQRDFKYTLIHTVKKWRRANIADLMKRLETGYGIISNNVFGYDAIAGNTESSKTFDHPGMKLMIEAMNKGDQSLQHWMASGSLQTNRKGLLYPYLSCIDPRQMTRTQLLWIIKERDERIKALQSDLDDKECVVVGLEVENDDLLKKNKRLKRRLEYYRERGDTDLSS